MAGALVAERLERARRALAAAEDRTGVQGLGQRALDRSQATAGLRIVPADGGVPPGPGPARLEAPEPPRDPSGPLIPLASLAEHLPVAACLPGAVVSVTGPTSALFAVAAAGWGGQAWGALAALPDAGLLAAAELGVPLARLVFVPALGSDPARLAGLLIDGFDLVVLGPLRLSGRQQRQLTARARRRGARLVAAGEWEGADVEVRAGVLSWRGADDGAGCLASPRLGVSCRQRRFAGQEGGESRSA